MNSNISKAAVWIARGVMITGLVAFIMLAVAVGKQNKKIKEYRQIITEQAETITDQTNTINRLWGEECVTVNVTCNITQKGLVTINQANQISKSVATYTRGQMLMAIDSLHNSDTINKAK